MLSGKYYFIHHNTFTIILLDLYTLIAAQWTLFKKTNLKLKT